MSAAETLPAVRGKLTEKAPLAPLVWFKSGGPADWLFEPRDADDLADIIQVGFHKWRRNHARLMMTEVIVTSSKPALAKILKKSIVLTMETTLIIKHGN